MMGTRGLDTKEYLVRNGEINVKSPYFAKAYDMVLELEA